MDRGPCRVLGDCSETAVRRVRGGWAATDVRAKDLELRLRRRSFGEFAAVDPRLALLLGGASWWLRLACPSRVCVIHRPETDATGSLDSLSSCAGGEEATGAAEGKKGTAAVETTS